MQLLTTTCHVESPFIIVKIGKWTFGQYSKEKIATNIFGAITTITFPNMVESLTVDKVNGTVNTYTINLVYSITAGDDPNLLERVFGSISDSREVTISYGDWNQPAFIYKEEVALVTKVSTRVDFAQSRINYTITAISNSVSLKSTLWNFGARTCKPSDEIFRILQNKSYGLQKVFTGMTNIQTIRNKGLIATDDKAVKIPAKNNINILDYLSYLVSYMTCVTNTGKNPINDSIYHLAIYDDISKEYEGTYFKVVKIPSKTTGLDSHDVFELDVGYPTNNFVTKFDLKTDDSYSILYNYAMENQNNYTYQLNEKGQVISDNLPAIFRNKYTVQNTAAINNWWTQVTQYPISASVEIRGLLRPAMLMQYVRVNSYFYGQKYIASGLYIITKQQDVISSTGYKTTLTLQRIGKDDEVFTDDNEVITRTGSSGKLHSGGGRH